MKHDFDNIIISVYIVVSAICEKLLPVPAQKQKLSDAEVITIAICSALFFNSNHDKALAWLFRSKFFVNKLSLSRYNRRIHSLKDFVEYCMQEVFTLFTQGTTYIEDSVPLPTCKRARACKNSKVRGREFCGYCCSKEEKFFGFRLHMVVDLDGIPVSIQILPEAFHDLTPVYEITSTLPENSQLLGDKAFSCREVENNLKSFGVDLLAYRKKNQHDQPMLHEELFIRAHRRQIETSFSILSEVMGINRLRARTLNGFLLKTYAAVLALVFHITLVIN